MESKNEYFELIHESDGRDSRIVIGHASASTTDEGKLTVGMALDSDYRNLRPYFRLRLEDYMDAVPERRQRTYGDHAS